MSGSAHNKAKQQVSNWLLLGVAMIMIQIVLGGITRLTESGLSITEWNPVTGALPPLNDAAWQVEFDKYKGTDQFRYVHSDFSIDDFKFIFFWEWFHRLWARLMGMVFLVGFVYFLVAKKLSREMVMPMVVLFILGGLQGIVGWLMVKSGLVPERYYVGHVELTTHLIMALLLLAYTLWFALKLKVSNTQLMVDLSMRRLTVLIAGILSIQLIYGGLMAGLKAAVMAPTWPDINGSMIPSGLLSMKPLISNFFNNPIAIHFIHRGLAYLLVLLLIAGWFKSRKINGSDFFRCSWSVALALVILQALLGILTVLNAWHSDRLVWLGISHQFIGISLMISVVCLLYLTKGKLSQLRP